MACFELDEYARRVPSGALKGLRVTGFILIAVGCMAIYAAAQAFVLNSIFTLITFCVIVCSPLLIATGAFGLVGGRGRSKTQCFIVCGLVLCVLIGAVTLVGIVIVRDGSYIYIMWSDIMWIALFAFGLLVAIVQAAFCCCSTCCCLSAPVDPPYGGGDQAMSSSDGGSGPPAYAARSSTEL